MKIPPPVEIMDKLNGLFLVKSFGDIVSFLSGFSFLLPFFFFFFFLLKNRASMSEFAVKIRR